MTNHKIGHPSPLLKTLSNSWRQGLFFALLFLAPLAGWGQTSLNLGGCYYIKSNAAQTYYLCPSEPCELVYAADQPYLTTNTTGDVARSVWYLTSEVVENVEYYYIVNVSEAKYLTLNNVMGTNNGNTNNTYNLPNSRLRVHLQPTPDDSPNQKSLFQLRYTTSNDYYTISPKLNEENGNSLNPAGDNRNSDCGTNHKKIYLYPDLVLTDVGGLIGLYLNTDSKSRWKLVSTGPAQPTISYNHPNVTFSHASSTSFKYTTDGRDPFLYGTTINGTSIDITEITGITFPCTIKAVALSEDICSRIATYDLEQVETPALEVISNRIFITCPTVGASIYYTTNGNPPDPTNSSQLYNDNEPLTCSGATIQAVAVKAGMVNSDTFSGSATLACDPPVITRTDATHFSIAAGYPYPDVTVSLFYSTDGNDPTTPYPGTPVEFSGTGIVKAKATADNFYDSPVASLLPGGGTPEDPYLISDDVSFGYFLSNNPSDGYYQLTHDVTAPSSMSSISIFSGTLEAAIDPQTKMPYRITGLNAPLFVTLSGTVKNLVFENVNITTTSGNTGAIACTANSSARIYNVGILSGSVGGTVYTGGLVGLLKDNGRVVNCYSYATITGGTTVGGIVGRNDVATTAATVTTGTMVMNCMFYGDITGGTTVSPIYGGNKISNLNGGLNNFNYYAYDKAHSFNSTDEANKAYNCALAVEEKYLKRFEFYRLLLNSNKKLAAIYASTNTNTVNPEDMAKWVLETADRAIDNPYPYPILKAQGNYPSIINPDIEHAPDSTAVGPNKGGKLGKTLSVTILTKSEKTPGGQSWPTATTSDVQTTSLTLYRTDKDFDRFNFNYDKVQLPYYNDIGTGNYTEDRVVTGWKITDITGGTEGTYTASDSWGGYNFADRKCTKKDLYSVSGRVFAQGAYFDVPYGVTAITIEPYWGKAAYIADEYYDKVSATDYAQSYVTSVGTQVNTIEPYTYFNEQRVYTTVSAALSSISSPGLTVYDNAVVLWGNFHQALINMTPFTGSTPFTLMSVDLDHDNEPDYSLIYHNNDRSYVCGIRFDFLNIPGTAQAQKPDEATTILNASVFNANDWFEITNTSSIYFSQFEYENSEKSEIAPIILLGGVYDQFVSTKVSQVQYTTYLHVGGNAWFHDFGNGTHSDGSSSTKHIPISITGGDFEGLYLTGTYKADAAVSTDDAECYISGGHFNEAAGAGLEQINGNVRWQIYDADIDNFYGGGTNDYKPILGNIQVDIYNSRVGTYCGGPKFGNMYIDEDNPSNNKMVTTYAEGCTFEKFFGAGFGGNSIVRKKYYDKSGTPNWSTLVGYFTTDKGKYFDGNSTQSSQNGGGTDYGKKGKGVATDFSYEYFVWNSGTTGARFFVKFAAFSLAQCNDVTSTLKNCTINGNFYGGGSLGKVVGNAVSELDGCTVNGNVYGAGFSATLPTVPVRTAGFTKDPKFNKYSGMFEPGEFSGTVDYTWKQVNPLPSNGTNGFDGTQVVTDQDLSHDNLGSVNAVSLTIKGNTFVQGSVFGGGEESRVVNNTEVWILDHAKVFGNVYGGGNMGEVGGNTTVRLQSQVLNDVFGGGNVAPVAGNTSVTIEQEDAIVSGNVYGGGNNIADDPDTGEHLGVADSEVEMTGGTVLGGIYGGCNSQGAVTGNAVVNILGGAIGSQDKLTDSIVSNVFGGGLGADTYVNGNVTVTIDKADGVSTAPTIYGDVYGGSALGSVNTPDAGNTTTLHILNGFLKTRVYEETLSNGQTIYFYTGGNVYGGGLGDNTHPAAVNGTVTVNIGSGTPDPINPATAEITDLDGNATIEGNVYGCNNANGSPQDDVTVNVFQTAHTDGTNDTPNNTVDGDAFAINNVFGGGNQADYTATDKTATVNIYGCGNTIKRVFGGGNAAAAPHVTTIIQGGRFSQIFGGGNGERGSQYGANINDGIDLYIHGGNVGQFFGGSNLNGTITGTINTSVDNNGPCEDNLVIDEYFCGGNFADISGDVETDIFCSDGMEFRDLYGGCNMASITGNVVLNVYGGTFENVYGGSKGDLASLGSGHVDKAANISGNVTLNLYGGTIENAFGGSNINGSIGGTITLNVIDKEDSDCPLYVTNIYGGCNLTSYTPDNSNITSPVVNVVHAKSGIGGNVYGGSKGVENATVTLTANPLVNIGYDASMDGYLPLTGANAYTVPSAPRAVIMGSVFGGGDAAQVIGNTGVFLRNKAVVIGNVYGGGNRGVVSGDTKVIVNGL
jgi:hypothetical protein